MTETRKPSSGYEQAAYEGGKQGMEDLQKRILAGGHDAATAEGMLAAFTSEHRTNQQITVKLIVRMLKSWAEQEEPRVCDLRNKAAYEFAKKIAEMDPGFPLI